ncbi:MAG: hypothetical protein QME05_04580 [Candidatus Margulisbacteria bacterium]|nr:hypothetical protein [Candidatus Margulisiibacteriota bacterium]
MLPAIWNKCIPSLSTLIAVITYLTSIQKNPIIKILSEEDWQTILREKDETTRIKLSLQSCLVTVDSNGRIQLPLHLYEHLALGEDRQVMVSFEPTTRTIVVVPKAAHPPTSAMII